MPPVLLRRFQLPTEPVALKPVKTLTGHTAGVLAVEFSPDGKLLASVGEDRRLLLWDADRGTYRAIPTEHAGHVVGVAFSPDGTRLTTVTSAADSCCVRLWDVDTGQSRGTLGGPNSGIWGAAWSPDGKRIAAVGWDNTLRSFDVATGAECLSIPEVCPRFTRGLAFAPSGKWIVTGGTGATRIWDANTGAAVATEPMPTMCPTFLPDGGIAGWQFDTGRVIVCDLPSGKVHMAWPAHRGLINGLAVSPNGRCIASFDTEGTVRIWQIDGAEPIEVATLTGHRGGIYFAAFTPDGTRLATAGQEDFTVKLWDLPPVCHTKK
ncbi:MAG: WD40 repeat domain-containing protein [Gemmatales bacterium]